MWGFHMYTIFFFIFNNLTQPYVGYIGLHFLSSLTAPLIPPQCVCNQGRIGRALFFRGVWASFIIWVIATHQSALNLLSVFGCVSLSMKVSVHVSSVCLLREMDFCFLCVLTEMNDSFVAAPS